MKYLIILFLCLNLFSNASCKENNDEPKKEVGKSDLTNQTKVQDLNPLNLNNGLQDDFINTNARLNVLSDSIKAINLRIEKTEESIFVKKKLFYTLTIALFIVNLILLILCGIIFYFLFMRLKEKVIYNELQINKPITSIGQGNQALNKIQLEMNKIQHEMNKIQHEMNKIQNNFRFINEKIDKFQNEKRNIQEEKISPTIDLPIENVESKAIKTESLFLSTPNDDGSFNQGNSSQVFKPTASFYRFEINSTNNSKADFYFVDDERAVITATDYPQTYIDPVCRAENAVNNHAKRILTMDPGTVEKSGDKWILIKKATIRYE